MEWILKRIWLDLGWIWSVLLYSWGGRCLWWFRPSPFIITYEASKGHIPFPKEPSRHLWQETNYRPRLQMFSVFFSVLSSFCLSKITRRGSLLLFYVCSKPNSKALMRALFVFHFSSQPVVMSSVLEDTGGKKDYSLCQNCFCIGEQIQIIF